MESETSTGIFSYMMYVLDLKTSAELQRQFRWVESGYSINDYIF